MTLLCRLLLACCLLATPLIAAAQTAPPSPESQAVENVQPDYSGWNMRADAIEAELDDPETSSDRLSALREELVAFRSQFQAAQNTNAPRIESLREQIAALGPAPEGDASEAPEIAGRRAELNAELARLRAPRIAAQEAFSRADSLIRRIDTTLRARQASELLAVAPYPWNPANWVVAVEEAYAASSLILREIDNTRSSTLRQRQFRANLPLISGLLLFGGFVLLRGRSWIENFVQRLRTGRAGTRLLGNSAKARRLVGLLLSLTQIVVPGLAVLAIYAAADASTMLGARSGAVAGALAFAGLAYFVARWVGLWLFPVSDAATTPLMLPEASRRQGRLLANFLGLMIGLYAVVEAFLGNAAATPAAVSVALFPVLVLTGIALFRLGQLMVAHYRAKAASSEDIGFNDRVLGSAGRLATVIALLVPLLAAVGYLNGAEALIFPALYSIGLIAGLLLVMRLIDDFYDLVTRRPDDAPEPLLPALLGFVLTIAALPLFALIWGVRDEDLLEFLGLLMAGFQIGETRIAPAALVVLLVVFVLGYYATRLVQSALGSSVLPKTRIDKGGQKAIISGTGYVGILVAALIAISTAGIDLSGLAIVAGALSVGIGFGLQNIVSNFISGLILLIERPIAEGDWIEVGGTMGAVRAISVRSTVIETFDRTDVIVPNTDLIAGTVTNWTRYNMNGRVIVPVGVAYGTDTRRVERILKEIGDAQPLALLDPAPYVVFADFGADALVFELRLMLSDVNFGIDVRTEIRHQIAERFAQEGITIPFAQRDVWLRSADSGGAVPAGFEPSSRDTPLVADITEADGGADGGR